MYSTYNTNSFKYLKYIWILIPFRYIKRFLVNRHAKFSDVWSSSSLSDLRLLLYNLCLIAVCVCVLLDSTLNWRCSWNVLIPAGSTYRSMFRWCLRQCEVTRTEKNNRPERWRAISLLSNVIHQVCNTNLTRWRRLLINRSSCFNRKGTFTVLYFHFMLLDVVLQINPLILQ